MINLILGRQGSGKTIYMVKTAYEYHLRNPQKKIYSNVHIVFNYKEITYPSIKNCQLIDCITLIDEIHQLLPARRSLSKINQEICDNFLSMARKQNNDIYGTTQTSRKVDVRFREEADYIHYCTKYAYLDNRWIEVLHDSMVNKDTLCMIKVDILDVISGNMVNNSFLANSYYPLYDTYEIIKIKGLEEAKNTNKKQ